MKITLYKDKNDLIIKLNSLAVALLLVSQVITRTLVRIKAFSGLQNNIFVLIAVLLCIVFSIGLTRKVHIPIQSFFLFFIIFANYIITLIFHYDETTLTAVQFIFYAVVPIYVISQKVDSETVLRYALYLSLITIPVINIFFEIQYEKYSQAYMGNIYAILPPILIAMIHFKLYRNNANFLVKVAYLYNLFVMIRIFFVANRGAIVCFFFCLMVLLINSYDNETRLKLKPSKTIFIILAFIVCIIIVMNALPLLESLQTFLQNSFNFVPSFISKMIKFLTEGDVSDGRTNINDFVINAINSKPVFGHGIKTFANYASKYAARDWPYPHQYIYQYLFEGGIVFSIIPIYFSLSLAVKVLSTRIVKKEEFALCCTLVCMCIPKLLLSTDVWDSTTIWMLITYSVLYTFKTNKYLRSITMKYDYRKLKEPF